MTTPNMKSKYTYESSFLLAKLIRQLLSANPWLRLPLKPGRNHPEPTSGHQKIKDGEFGHYSVNVINVSITMDIPAKFKVKIHMISI